MIPFSKPSAGARYDDMGAEAIRRAMEDGGLAYSDVEQAFAGYVYTDSCAGQRVIYRAGLTGILIVNVNTNCATESSALYLARQAIEGGLADCALAVGFEQMDPGPLPVAFPDRASPFTDLDAVVAGQVDIALPNALRTPSQTRRRPGS